MIMQAEHSETLVQMKIQETYVLLIAIEFFNINIYVLDEHETKVFVYKAYPITSADYLPKNYS